MLFSSKFGFSGQTDSKHSRTKNPKITFSKLFQKTANSLTVRSGRSFLRRWAETRRFCCLSLWKWNYWWFGKLDWWLCIWSSCGHFHSREVHSNNLWRRISSFLGNIWMLRFRDSHDYSRHYSFKTSHERSYRYQWMGENLEFCTTLEKLIYSVELFKIKRTYCCSSGIVREFSVS